MTYAKTIAATLAMTTIVLSIFVLVGVSSKNNAYAQENKTQGIMVPLYMYPGETWDNLVKAKKEYFSVPIVAIVNPASGPGSYKDANYEGEIAKLQDAGVVVIGYVSTAYTGRDINSVKADIDRWDTWYPNIDGIFFDEQTNWAGGEWYYDQLDSYAKSKELNFTVGNPGANSIPSYLDTVDVVLIYESPGLPNLSNYVPTWDKHDNGKLGMIPFGVGSLPMEWVTNSAQTIGWIYVTNDVLSNPWDSLPYYFAGLTGAVKENNDRNGVSASTIKPDERTSEKDNSGKDQEKNLDDRQDLRVKASKSGHGAVVRVPRSGESVYMFVLEVSSDLKVRPEKAPRGWTVEDIGSKANLTAIAFETEDRPVKVGRSKMFSVDTGEDGKRGTTRIVANWYAYDIEGSLIDKGAVNLKKD